MVEQAQDQEQLSEVDSALSRRSHSKTGLNDAERGSAGGSTLTVSYIVRVLRDVDGGVEITEVLRNNGIGCVASRSS